jgi:hypothetical protein
MKQNGMLRDAAKEAMETVPAMSIRSPSPSSPGISAVDAAAAGESKNHLIPIF